MRTTTPRGVGCVPSWKVTAVGLLAEMVHGRLLWRSLSMIVSLHVLLRSGCDTLLSQINLTFHGRLL